MIPINEDFEKAYKDSLAKGFTVRELLAIGSAVAVLASICAIGFFLLHWNLYLAFMIGMIPAGIIVVVGFWHSPSGLNVKEAYEARKYRKNTRLLCWKATEYEDEIKRLEEIMAVIEVEKEKKKQ